jgi:hypothetical protein
MQAGANRSQQFLVIDRFLEKRDGAGFEGTFLIALGIASREHDYGNARKCRVLL